MIGPAGVCVGVYSTIDDPNPDYRRYGAEEEKCLAGGGTYASRGRTPPPDMPTPQATPSKDGRRTGGAYDLPDDYDALRDIQLLRPRLRPMRMTSTRHLIMRCYRMGRMAYRTYPSRVRPSLPPKRRPLMIA